MACRLGNYDDNDDVRQVFVQDWQRIEKIFVDGADNDDQHLREVFVNINNDKPTTENRCSIRGQLRRISVHIRRCNLKTIIFRNQFSTACRLGNYDDNDDMGQVFVHDR